MKRNQQHKECHDILHLCAYAAEKVREAGFEHVSTSRQSETVYFRFPGREWLLRISTHKSKHSPIGLGNVAAKITFRGNYHKNPEHILKCSWKAVDARIQQAIGLYMIESLKPLPPSKYEGKKNLTNYELWVTQGQGGYKHAEFTSLEAALVFAKTHPGASLAIKMPDSSWYDWEQDGRPEHTSPELEDR